MFNFSTPKKPVSERPTVVITGASSGIGRATALAFAKARANLVLAARGRRALEALAGECEELGAQALAVSVDVTDAQAMRTLSHAAITRFDCIDVWINNVGVGAVGAYDATPMDAHRRVIEANLIGHMNGAHAVLPHFKARGQGILINMISVAGWVAAPYAAAYSASKFGLRGFSEALRAEVSNLPHVHVCEVYPTFVDTPGMAHGANYSGKTLKPPPPLLDPRTVAAQLVALSQSPCPVTAIGSVAWPARVAHAAAPGLTGRITAGVMRSAFKRASESPTTDGNLFTPSRDHSIDGGHRAARAGASHTASLAAAALLAMAALGLALARARK